jgi:integrase
MDTTMAADNLVLRGRQWYFKLNIPRSLRQYFPSQSGKPRDAIWEPLGPDLTIAKPRCAQRVADYEAIFARLRAGEHMTPEQIKAALAVDTAAELARFREMLKQQFADMRRQTAEILDEWERSHPQQEAPSQLSELDLLRERVALDYLRSIRPTAASAAPAPTPASAETISQAAEHWFAEMKRPGAAVKATTLDGHRLRVRAFIDHAGDLPLTSVTRAMASDFLANVAAGRSNRTTNNYATTMAALFKSAAQRGRFEGSNPFEDQKRKAKGESYAKFTPDELNTLFAALPREIEPAKHSPETALPWAALVAAYSGARLEEIAQLAAADIRNEGANGATVTVIDIHNGGRNHLKNESSKRLVPVHSELVRAGFLDYVKALPQGAALFPGLTRRASKGDKIGARVGEIFRKRLEALGLKRKGLCFHSFRHTFAKRLEATGVRQTDVARVLGHSIPGMTFGVYGGAELKILAGVVEALRYDDVPALSK